MYRDAREDIAPPPTAPPAEEEYEVAEQPPVHLPPLSIWPITLALGITITGAGVITTAPVSFVGIIISLIAIIYWIQELRHEHQHSHTH